jgi:hypothetical protein
LLCGAGAASHAMFFIWPIEIDLGAPRTSLRSM